MSPDNVSRLSIKAVLLGGITDVFATNVARLPLLGIAAARANLAAVPKAQQAEAVMAVMEASPELQAAALVVGCLCTALGGYVAARVAGRSQVLHGALSSYLAVAFGFAALFTALQVPLWQHVAGLLVSPALGAAGGWIRLWQTQRPMDPSDDLSQYFEPQPTR